MLPREQIYEKLLGKQGLFVGGRLANLRAGDRYSLRAATGETYAGRVEFVTAPRGFCVTIEDLNDALLWLSIEGMAAPQEVGLWLSAYGVSQAQVGAFDDRWALQLAKIFP